MNKIEPTKDSKKIAIVSYGVRISLNAKNIRSRDLVYLREYLLNVLGKEQVDYVSKKTKKEKHLDFYKNIVDTDLNDYDEVYIYNCSMNAFGGIYCYESLVTVDKLYSFNGKITFFVDDPKLVALNMSIYVKSKDKDGSYRIKCDKKDKNGELTYYQFEKETLDNWTEKVWKRMQIAHTGNDYEKLVRLWNESHKNEKDKLNEDCDWFSIWLFEYISVNEDLKLKLTDYKKQNNPYDLVYFGNNRHNNRNNIIKKLYDIPEFKKYFIGFDPELSNTDVNDYVVYDELFRILGEKCLATVVVGDVLHNGNIKTARFFEGFLLDIVTFISIDYDPDKTYVHDDFLKDFIYVSTKDELKERVGQIKNDPELYKKIVDLERKEILDSYGKYKCKKHDPYSEEEYQKKLTKSLF